MSEAIGIRQEITDNRRIVFMLEGRFDAGNTDAVKDALKQAIGSGVRQVVVDMTQVPFIDSAGLSTLVSALKLSRRAGGDVVLAGVQPQTLTVFSLTMLDKVFAIYPTRQSALDSLK
jgi:anti-sigma B factor antagonist